MTKPSVASKLVEINHPDACPPQWLPVLLASSSRREDNPAPRFDDEDLLFEGKNEALSMERRMDEAIGCADPDTVWACTLICHQVHRLVEPGHSNCKAKCPTHCPLPPPLASPSPQPPFSPDHPTARRRARATATARPAASWWAAARTPSALLATARASASARWGRRSAPPSSSPRTSKPAREGRQDCAARDPTSVGQRS